ncbi:MAG: hypothetical protein K2G37_04870 [Clostridia bacterium]|nr:hypothetical protein [Clostridia bacterium]MDE7328307.1 hypothetical protein [Clostridia bacterium]
MKFTIKRKGYDKSEVQEYIKAQTDKYEKTILGLRDRVEGLLRENQDLLRKVDSLKKEQDSVNLALTQAIDKAKNIEYSSKVKFALEGERLKVFSSKWESYCKANVNVVDKAQRDGVRSRLREFEDELIELLSKDLNIGDYVNEADIDFFAESQRLKGENRQ